MCARPRGTIKSQKTHQHSVAALRFSPESRVRVASPPEMPPPAPLPTPLAERGRPSPATFPRHKQKTTRRAPKARRKTRNEGVGDGGDSGVTAAREREGRAVSLGGAARTEWSSNKKGNSWDRAARTGEARSYTYTGVV